MTDDIVARLRGWPDVDDAEEAADEIERLRAELAAERQSKGTHHLWAQIRKHNAERKAAEAERDALRELLKKARSYVYGKTITDRELGEEIDAALNQGDRDE